MPNEKSRGFKIVLIVSLCFNLFFLTMAAALFLKVHSSKTFQGRFRYIAGSLKLTREQKIDLWRLVRTIRQYKMDSGQDDLINGICDELSRKDPDYEKIDGLISDLVETRGKILTFTGQRIEPFIKELTYDQRQLIVQKIQKVTQ